MSRFILIFLTVVTLFHSPTFADDSLEQLVRNASALKLNLFGDDLLQPEQAFEFSASVKDGNTLYVNWEIAPNYYLYREKIKLELVHSNGTKLDDYTIPNGLPKHDEAFGEVETFSDSLNFDVPLVREDHGTQTIKLRASFQGCAERGVCYPPMTKEIILELPVAHQLKALPDSTVEQTHAINVPPLMLFFFGMTLIIIAVYLNALDSLPENSTAWQKLSKGVGVVMLIYGFLILADCYALGNLMNTPTGNNIVHKN